MSSDEVRRSRALLPRRYGFCQCPSVFSKFLSRGVEPVGLADGVVSWSGRPGLWTVPAIRHSGTENQALWSRRLTGGKDGCPFSRIFLPIRPQISFFVKWRHLESRERSDPFPAVVWENRLTLLRCSGTRASGFRPLPRGRAAWNPSRQTLRRRTCRRRNRGFFHRSQLPMPAFR